MECEHCACYYEGHACCECYEELPENANPDSDPTGFKA